MKLRGKLLLAASLVVALPLLGLQFVGRVESLLRQGQEQALIDSARALASVAPRPADGPVGSDALYVHAARQPLLLDGYGDDWSAWLELTERVGPDGRASAAAPEADRPLSLALAESPSGLHVLLRVHDDDTRFARADGEPGDHVELRFAGPGGTGRMEIVPTAPGRFTRTAEPGGWPVVHGVWQAHATGWNLELRIPLRDRPTRLGVSVFDVDRGGESPTVLAIPGRVPLVSTDPELSSRLAEVVPGSMRAWLVTRHGHVLARADRAVTPALAGRSPSTWQRLLFERLAGDALAPGPPPGRFSARLTGADLAAARAGELAPVWTLERDGDGPGARVRVALALDDESGAGSLLVLERDADALLLLASDAVLRLAGVSLVTFLAAAGVLLAFAWRLSTRIRRLQRCAEASVADDGKVVVAPGAIPEAAPGEGRRGDEITGLSRSVAALLERLRAHQQYLATLAERLSHELRTPLTMIGSSLDNLAGQFDTGEPVDPEPARRYLERAGQGSRRLNRIFQAMSQAARLEEALIDEPFEHFDLAALVDEYCAARRPACPDHSLEFDNPSGPVEVSGSPDLIAQLLDKLVDNAVEFAPTGSVIRVVVRRAGSTARLDVENDGPRIDPAGAAELFEPMVTHRASGGETPHLGLGLFIARLIARRHDGRMRAEAIASGSRFSLELPGLPNRGPNRGPDRGDSRDTAL